MNDPITSGRDALSPWSGYPWYDAKADDLHRVDIPQEWHSDVQWDFSLGFLGSTIQIVAWTAIALLLIVLLYFLVRAFWNRGKAVEAAEKEPLGEADRVEALPFPVDLDHINFLEEADRCRRQGDYARAVVYLYSHQLLRLDKRGRIHLTRGKTNRQYMREIAAAPLRGLVEQTMALFEAAFFGHRSPDPAEFDTCWTRLDDFEAMTGVE
jgi:hypothetical protein